MATKEIIEFYDKFIDEQRKAGINDRIYKLYRRLKRLGLKSNSNVLELGCGIGTMTFLLSKTVLTGKIEAVDISPESIKFAKQHLKKPNILYFAHDIVSYTPSIQNIDFIILFDVIEHIPIEKHNQLFYNLSKACNIHTKILINIPNPEYIRYDMENTPGDLQIIDQPLPLSFILQNIENNNLSLTSFTTYSIWVENDYQFFVINKKKIFNEIILSDKERFLQKAFKKIKRTFIKLNYNYC